MKTTAHSGYTKTQTSGALAVVTGASLWGLFWIPLRYLDTLGVSALWALTFVMAAALLPALIMTVIRSELTDLRQRVTLRAGLVLGLATTLYFIALIYTDVIRVVFLFYLLPLWTTLSARVIYGEPISIVRLVIMFVALVGLWLLLSEGDGIPVPRSAGDWCAIASGMCWGISLSLLRADENSGAYSRTLVAIGSAMLFSLLATLWFHLSNSTIPSQSSSDGGSSVQTQALLIALIAISFGALALYPAMLAQIWGASRIPAPTAALLTMSEIIVAILSAAILIGTDLPPMAIVGGSIIIFALCLDIVLQMAGSKKPRR